MTKKYVHFDDAKRSILNGALTAAVDQGFSVSVFVPTAHLGYRTPGSVRRVMNESELREVRATFPEVEIGSHGHFHSDMSGYRSNQVDDEVLESFRILERLEIGYSRVIAWPGGRAPLVSQWVRENVVAAFSVHEPGSTVQQFCRHCIPRMSVCEQNVRQVEHALFSNNKITTLVFHDVVPKVTDPLNEISTDSFVSILNQFKIAPQIRVSARKATNESAAALCTHGNNRSLLIKVLAHTPRIYVLAQKMMLAWRMILWVARKPPQQR